jgi:hypothetical protein
VLFHMMSNSVWGIFANFDTYYDPRIMCIVLLAAVIVVMVLWATTTLTLFRKV